ncbi:ATP-binding cassette domain-containing protein [uncultured Sphingopyxis sp.]|uniref:ATP-binding cassette domain-containing protein n=1 Tax=uncultured Sphingopyxis sp. TaxID=310581 RepID=UPI002596C50F|nr:ATP-binding cassette domain-containing protein [uncultured Sphingopyxis sp.]
MSSRDNATSAAPAASRGALAAWLGDAVAAVLFALALAQLLALHVARDLRGGGGGDAGFGIAGWAWMLLLVGAALARGALQGGAFAIGLRHAARFAAELRARVAPALMVSAAGRGRLIGEDAELAVTAIDRIEPYVARFLPLRRAAMLSPLLIALAALPASSVAAAILFGTLLPFAIGMALAGSAAARASEAQLGALSRLGGLFVDRVRALPLILSYGAEDRVTRQIGGAARDLAERTLGVLRIAFASSAILEFFSALAVALVAVYCGFSLLGLLPFRAPESLDFAEAFYVLALAPEFYLGMRRLAAAYHDKQQGEAALAALAAAEAPTAVHTVASPLPGAPAVLVVDALVVRHPEGAAIGPISARWTGPGLYLIVGPSGSGKTSLLRALIGQVPVESGRLYADDAAIDPRALAPLCGWAGQRPLLLPGSLRTNLLVGGSNVGDAAIIAKLDALGLASLIAARGGGIDWVVDDRGSGLSGGERRRIGLARALLSARPLLLLDEPTADLDAASAARVVVVLQAAAMTRTVIAATHDPALIALADSVVEIG